MDYRDNDTTPTDGQMMFPKSYNEIMLKVGDEFIMPRLVQTDQS